MLSNIWIFFAFSPFVSEPPPLSKPHMVALGKGPTIILPFCRCSSFLSAVVLITKRDLNEKELCSSGASFLLFLPLVSLVQFYKKRDFWLGDRREAFYLIFTREFSSSVQAHCRFYFIESFSDAVKKNFISTFTQAKNLLEILWLRLSIVWFSA